MSNFRRLRRPAVPYPAPAARRGERRALPTLACLAIAVSGLLFGAAPAGALVSGSIGVQPRGPAPVEAKALQYHGGAVMHSSDAYVIYWDPVGNYRGDWERLIDRYFQDVGAASGQLGDVFALDTQYRDSLGPAANQTTFRGSFKDKDKYPTSGCSEPEPASTCLTDAQIQAELQHVIGSGSLPGATGPPVYYLLTPPGVTVCTSAPGSSSTCSNSKPLEKEDKEIEEEEIEEPGGEPRLYAHTGICGYHSALGLGGANPAPYAVQPWIAGNAGFVSQLNPLKTFEASPDVLACQNGGELQEPNQLEGVNPFGDFAEGLADVIVSGLSVEQHNIVTDPFFNGWYQTGQKAEQGDMCQRSFGPPPETPPVPNKNTHAANVSNETINGDPYYVQWAFNSSGVSAADEFGCWSGVALEPFFTAPNPVNSGDVVGFNGTESLITLDARAENLAADEPLRVPVYSWNFGDGSTASGANAATEFHSYVYGGSYNVTLTVTDGGGNVNETSRTITVIGPAPPTSANPATAGSGSTGATGAGTTPAAGATGKSAARPVATAVIASQSLSSALKNGVSVRYSVNQQVAGRFEVLLASSIAHKLGLKGARATGLAKGTPAQTIIAKAILVTTKGGHGTYKIKLSKATAAKLRKLRRVSLMIRMVVHNAASPAVTTVLSTASLSH